MHFKLQFKQQKMVISPRSVSPDYNEKVQKVKCLENTPLYSLLQLRLRSEICLDNAPLYILLQLTLRTELGMKLWVGHGCRA
jgi:hypothetical protein